MPFPDPSEPLCRATAANIHRFIAAILIAAGTCPRPRNRWPTRSPAPRCGAWTATACDSSFHYAKVVQTGRINPDPQIEVFADRAWYWNCRRRQRLRTPCQLLCRRPRYRPRARSGHRRRFGHQLLALGAAGAYALHAANQGFAALSVCDSRLLRAAPRWSRALPRNQPSAFAAPVSGQRPYLVEWRPASCPESRSGHDGQGPHPSPDVAVDTSGEPTTDPARSSAMLPLGGVRYGSQRCCARQHDRNSERGHDRHGALQSHPGSTRARLHHLPPPGPPSSSSIPNASSRARSTMRE